MGLNVFTAIGRVGKDAVCRFTQAGKPVTGWSLAVDTGFGDNKKTIWLECNLWGERGQKVAAYITKGSQLGVSGELGTREYDGKTYVTLNVANVSLIGGKPEGGRAESRHREESPPPRHAPQDDFQDSEIPF